ncbi:MAG TPA: hypothetical protein VID28_02085 [Methylomirabilota bacterium]|jgi:hypothetical protein
MRRSVLGPPVGGLLLVAALAGCGSAALGPAFTSGHAPTYTEEELARYCALRGGWWRADETLGGHCEFEGAGFQ